MSFSYKSTNEVLYLQLNNLPINIFVGYGQTNGGGKVYKNDGSFIMYYSVNIEYVTSPLTQITSNHSLIFTEIPCDNNGNSLIRSYWFGSVNGYLPSEKIYVMIDCEKEPTHRINIGSGEIISNKSDNDYIKDLILTYQIADKN